MSGMRAWQHAFRSRVNLIQAPAPLRVRLQRLVARGMKVSVRVLAATLEANDLGIPITEAKWQRSSRSIFACSISKFKLKIGNCAHAGFFSLQRLSTTRAMYSATRIAS